MNRGQTKKGSLAEAIANILVGCGLAFVSQLVIFAHYNIRIPLATNAWMTFYFTLVSLARSFVLRRLFNYFSVRTPSQPWVNIAPDGKPKEQPITEAASIAAMWPR